MDESALERLSAEQLAGLSDEQKAVFCTLTPQDQDFFARTFSPKDLPGALTRKGEIMKRHAEERERLAAMLEALRKGAQEHQPVEDEAGGTLTALAAGVLGVGAVAAVATDGSASYQGVKPDDFIAPLQAEFNGRGSLITFSGDNQNLTGTISLITNAGAIPALTITLARTPSGCDVKVNDLTRPGMLEIVKQGGKRLLGLAGAGISLLRGDVRGVDDLFDKASRALSEGAGLAEIAGHLQLKERAWKVIRQTAEALEAAYLKQKEAKRAERLALERAWDAYYACPTCSVPFGDGDTECRVCGSARPAQPSQPDPRRK
ncbi:hypothetical protein [Anaerolinea thermophila]|uniref:Uncharacterized protein n=1 Tax=Anaerolinea thermophila (strain DSM 14523 / JCM 11388 / NBRC 100420 / UNI-1) TaxID=926569 RepID=E8N2L1_ANATU|nr:hypothetical protein [Anaerolinea thermophila]BAJ62817.1 hypothetical protein ANT_07830 [Anaerolinea thermophila UNI-1]